MPSREAIVASISPVIWAAVVRARENSLEDPTASLFEVAKWEIEHSTKTFAFGDAAILQGLGLQRVKTQGSPDWTFQPATVAIIETGDADIAAIESVQDIDDLITLTIYGLQSLLEMFLSDEIGPSS